MSNQNFIKKGIPLCPIVNTINSPTCKLYNLLSIVFQPFVGKTSSFMKNSTSFVLFIQNIHLKPTNIVAIFYVISLFTKIRIQEDMEMIYNFVT